MEEVNTIPTYGSDEEEANERIWEYERLELETCRRLISPRRMGQLEQSVCFQYFDFDLHTTICILTLCHFPRTELLLGVADLFYQLQWQQSCLLIENRILPMGMQNLALTYLDTTTLDSSFFPSPTVVSRLID